MLKSYVNEQKNQIWQTLYIKTIKKNPVKPTENLIDNRSYKNLYLNLLQSLCYSWVRDSFVKNVKIYSDKREAKETRGIFKLINKNN